MEQLENKYCAVCGRLIPKTNKEGKSKSKSNYLRQKYCSLNCKYIGVAEKQTKENPRTKERLYHVWMGMKQRCRDKKGVSSKWYVDRGITVCEEWVNDYESFKKWALSNGYDETKSRKEQSLDRIDNNKGYSPDNCRFVSHSKNCKNTRRNVFLTYKGKTMCINDWSKELGISISCIRERLKKTNDVNLILETATNAHKSNTDIKGISWQEKEKRYLVYGENHTYLGVRKTLEEAVILKNGIK